MNISRLLDPVRAGTCFHLSFLPWSISKDNIIGSLTKQIRDQCLKEIALYHTMIKKMMYWDCFNQSLDWMSIYSLKSIIFSGIVWRTSLSLTWLCWSFNKYTCHWPHWNVVFYFIIIFLKCGILIARDKTLFFAWQPN